MKNLKSVLLITLALSLSACGEKAKDAAKPDTPANQVEQQAGQSENREFMDDLNMKMDKPSNFADKLAYLQGLQMGKQLQMMELNPDYEYILMGLKHGYYDDKEFMNIAEISALQQEVMKEGAEIMKKVEEKKMKEFTENGKKAKAEGEAFLAKNKTADGVQTSKSGLQYKIIKAGEGNKAKDGDLLLVHLKGNPLGGEEIENTFNGEPMPFLMDKKAMPAWREALMLIGKGGRIKIWAPAKLAFGEKGLFPQIPPHSVMEFEIELVDNQGKAPMQQMQMPQQMPQR